MHATSELRSIYDLSLNEWLEFAQKSGEPEYRSLQIWQGLYHHFWQTPDDFTMLPAHFRSAFNDNFRFISLSPIQVMQSSDGETVKTLFRLADNRCIESVLMFYDQRHTLCISTQVGCAMGCVFCATGQMGFKRNLTSGEIVEQVIYYARYLRGLEEKVTNVVIMGMGEPFQNYDATLAAIDRLNHPEGFNLGARRFTISTIGLVHAIRRFADEKRQINLAISLHAANDELRTRLLPVNRRFPIRDLFDACVYYVQQTNRRITFEWALIQGQNDTIKDARELAEKLKGLLCHVNLIPLNPTRNYQGQPTSPNKVIAFRAELEKAGIPCTVRIRRGIDIHAGCGQLANPES